MGWTFFFLMVVLKVPIVALLWIVWWAIKAAPDTEAGGQDDGGTHRPNSPQPRTGPGPGRPRGPHGEPSPPSPPRTRPVRRPASRPVRP